MTRSAFGNWCDTPINPQHIKSAMPTNNDPPATTAPANPYITRPITPQEADEAKLANIPPEVIEAFNELITEGWSGQSVNIKQDAAVERVMAKMNIPHTEVFRRFLLDVEPLYRAAGWQVKFDKPGYNETYDAYYVFSKQQ